jgi:hypothetical protein
MGWIDEYVNPATLSFFLLLNDVRQLLLNQAREKESTGSSDTESDSGDELQEIFSSWTRASVKPEVT